MSSTEPFFIGLALAIGFVALVLVMIRSRRLREELEQAQAELRESAENARHAAEAAESVAEAVTLVQFRTDQPPESLIEACAYGKCALFTGAGIGVLADIPDWPQVLTEIVKNRGRDLGDDAVTMRNLLARGEFDSVTELLETRLGRADLVNAIWGQLRWSGASVGVLDNVVQDIPISAFVTTNFDDLIEQSLARAGRPLPRILSGSTRDVSRAMRSAESFLLHLHGALHEPENIVLTASELRASLEETGQIRSLLGSLFETRTALFIGLPVDRIEGLWEAAGMRRGTSQRHYAVVADDPDFDAFAERFSARYNIQLLRLAQPAALAPFLEDLSRRVRERHAQLARQKSFALTADRQGRIAGLTLRNIGPFENAAFSFTKDWAVILGNNGVGKSTVLRALAFALCGAEGVDREGARALLRRGASSGSIEVHFDTSPNPITLTTEIAVDQGRLAIRANMAALDAGMLVAFGFPAVRGIPPRGGFDPTAEESIPFPRIEDVLPLVQGGVDERASSLRRWIFNGFVRSQDPALPKASRSRHHRTIDRFFALIDAMTPGFDLRFSRCDTETFEILLATSDGEVPMDYLSQGMNSTMGWAGIVIQRLAEIYADQDDPTKQRALLLIDEIDSHLHPEWQMSIVPILKEYFPNAQVIATTHSPLIVGNLDEHEVIRVGRSEGGLVVEHLPQSFIGYRADQVLTDAPFELDSTRASSWEEMRDEYTLLLGQPDRNDEEEERFAWLEDELMRAPPALENRAERDQMRAADAQLRKAILAAATDDDALKSLRDDIDRSLAGREGS